MGSKPCPFLSVNAAPMAEATPDDVFQALVVALRDRLGPCSGINSEDVDANELQTLMKSYISNETEWGRYALRDPSRNYTRNLVDKGNGKSNLLILVWTPGKESAIHDHADAHCIMKILKGQLIETRFHQPTVSLNNNETGPLQQRGPVKEYTENDVAYMADTLGLHKISNPDPNQYAVSLHLYTPPNAAVYGCNTFNEKTGKPTHIKVDFFSEYGTPKSVKAKREPHPQVGGFASLC